MSQECGSHWKKKEIWGRIGVFEVCVGAALGRVWYSFVCSENDLGWTFWFGSMRPFSTEWILFPLPCCVHTQHKTPAHVPSPEPGAPTPRGRKAARCCSKGSGFCFSPSINKRDTLSLSQSRSFGNYWFWKCRQLQKLPIFNSKHASSIRFFSSLQFLQL